MGFRSVLSSQVSGKQVPKREAVQDWFPRCPWVSANLSPSLLARPGSLSFLGGRRIAEVYLELFGLLGLGLGYGDSQDPVLVMGKDLVRVDRLG